MQMEWLRASLEDGPKFISCTFRSTIPVRGDHHFLDQRKRCRVEELGASRVLAVFSGHVHMFSNAELDGVSM